MKCPKCGYLGFEPVDRCRNCGYDFSLAAAPADLDLAMRTGATPLKPLDDLSIGERIAQPRAAESSSAPPAELPLFEPPADDEPLIRKASPPRVPLAVRRATPEVHRVRTESPRRDTLEFELDVAGPPVAEARRTDAAARSAPAAAPETQDAGIGSRFAAFLIDFLILIAVDAIVIYFTMQICGLTIGELGILPKAPLLAFLILQNGGYLVAFTAGGQTLGKMAAGIRVVNAGSGAPLDLGHAILRTLIWLVLAGPAGLGFLTALFSRDHRGLHDRFAGTRVIRASA